MSGSVEPVGTLDVALDYAARLLSTRPELAAEQASEILRYAPVHPEALRLLAAAHRACGDDAAALAVLETLCRNQPKLALAHYERGAVLGALGRGEEAVDAFRHTLRLSPGMAEAWLALADHLHAMGLSAEADAAYGEQVKASTGDPALMAAASALYENRIPEAEAALREHLKRQPTDVAAIRMLAEVAVRVGRLADAENLLVRCLELSPSFAGARHNLASVLHKRNKPAEALAEAERLLAEEPGNPAHRNLKAAILTRIGDYDTAIRLYAGVLADYPNQPKVWLNQGHALKTAGREAESVEAYRRCIALSPTSGEAYWSLANLKTFRFTSNEVSAMYGQLARTEPSEEERLHFHFALGKALEDAGNYAESFDHYARANRIRRELLPYDADETSALVVRSKAQFTPGFFAERKGYGAPDADPIFIVGLPRAGSTLLEQILSSHSAVEGTMELSDLTQIAAELRTRRPDAASLRYPQVLDDLTAEQCREIGALYLSRTRIQRQTDAPFFIDKMPNNFVHVGLIHLALPNAKIVDARRHPLGCGFSIFKQHFARGQAFAYGLEDIGRYYRDYVDLMDHYDAVLPGRAHRVNYEDMVADPEAEVGKLLAYCGLPFEPQCLRFYESKRAVRTASSQQVRQPIFRDGVDQWRNYAPWLEPLRAALGPTLADAAHAGG